MSHARPVFPAFPDWDFLVAAFGGGLLLTGMRIQPLAARLEGKLALLSAPPAPRGSGSRAGSDRYRAAHAANLACTWAAFCASAGITAVPSLALHIALGDMEADLDAPGTAFWADWSDPLLAAAHGLIVPPILSWRNSDWVWREATTMLRAGKPVFCLSASQLVEPRG